MGPGGFFPSGLFFALLGFSLLAAPRPANARDTASLQIAIPTPDPVVAGEKMIIQTLAVNTGTEIWQPGSYFWEAEVYDIERKFLVTLRSIKPTATVSPGGVSSAELQFNVPDNYLGRRYFRVFLTRNGKRLLESRYIPFQIAERVILPVKVPDYNFGGNFTFLLKRSADDGFSGSTTGNLVGKLPTSSFLFNMHLLHSDSKLIDPDIVLLNFYAPWGVVNMGDIAPGVSQLALSSKGMRGISLEQGVQRNEWQIDWIGLFGRTDEEISGTSSTNGRFRRSLFGLKASATPPSGRYKIFANFVRSGDDQGSLSSDPFSPNFRGPTLKPIDNALYGGGFEYSIIEGMDLTGEFQASSLDTDITIGTSSLTGIAYRSDLRYRTNSFQGQFSYQRVGTNFISLGAPNAIPDRVTFDASFGWAPKEGVNLFASGNQFSDNLENDPTLVKTKQRILTFGSSLLLASKSNVGLSYSLNTAVGEPSTTQDNATNVFAFSLTQPIGRQIYSLSLQQTGFKDKTGLSDNLDTFTIGARAALSLTKGVATSMGGTTSSTKNKVDGSKRTSNSFSISIAAPLKKDVLSSQVFTSMTKTKNNSGSTPGDTASFAASLEFTWQAKERLAITLGGSISDFKDKITPTLDNDDLILQTRVSYTF